MSDKFINFLFVLYCLAGAFLAVAVVLIIGLLGYLTALAVSR